jgi:hypothetical protein
MGNLTRLTRTKSCCFVVVARLILSFVASMALFSPASGAGLVFERTTATVTPGEGDKMIGAEYRFTNSLAEPVEIVNVTTSCGCIVAEADKTRYAPGESGVVTAIYHIGTASGTQRHTITVATNESPDQRYLLTIVVELPKGVSTGIPTAAPVKPAKLIWTRPPFASKTVTVDLTRARSDQVKVSCDRDTFAFEIRKIPDKREVAIVVTPLPNAESGQAELTLSFENEAGELTHHKVTLHILSAKPM